LSLAKIDKSPQIGFIIRKIYPKAARRKYDMVSTFFLHNMNIFKFLCPPEWSLSPFKNVTFTKWCKIAKNTLKIYLFYKNYNIFQEQDSKYELPYVLLYWKNDLVYFTISSHFTLSTKAKASKVQLFFSKWRILTRLLDFSLWLLSPLCLSV
jgi:hypothetical protein